MTDPATHQLSTRLNALVAELARDAGLTVEDVAERARELLGPTPPPEDDLAGALQILLGRQGLLDLAACAKWLPVYAPTLATRRESGGDTMVQWAATLERLLAAAHADAYLAADPGEPDGQP